MLRLALALALSLASAACTVETVSTPAPTTTSEEKTREEGPTPETKPVEFDAARVCPKIAASIASCAGDPSFESACASAFKNAAERGCGKFLPALQSWVLENAQPYACIEVSESVPAQPMLATNAPVGAVAADACAAAVNDPECFSVPCERSLDCPRGSSCSSVTKHCFVDGKNHCAGLPCDSSLGCPTGGTCNKAMGVCTVD